MSVVCQVVALSRFLSFSRYQHLAAFKPTDGICALALHSFFIPGCFRAAVAVARPCQSATFAWLSLHLCGQGAVPCSSAARAPPALTPPWLMLYSPRMARPTQSLPPTSCPPKHNACVPCLVCRERIAQVLAPNQRGILLQARKVNKICKNQNNTTTLPHHHTVDAARKNK